MPRVSQTTQVVTSAGADLTLTAPAVSPNGDITDLGARTFLVVFNGSGAPINVTIDTTTVSDGLALPDRVTAVGAGKTAVIPLSDTNYRQITGADIGRGYVDYSAVASVTRAIIRL